MVTITATYSPEDNKIRLYASSRLDAETYAKVKEAGFAWAPKQELFVAPKWTPAREDLAIELAGDIEPEEMTLAERATIKAERLDALAAKRQAQAVDLNRRADELSQAFYMGQPILVGHHSERKARKTQERMQSATSQAVKAHNAANYWLYRATGVEAFANMKNCTRTRINRIKTLLAELRDLQRGINDAHKAIDLWAKFDTPERVMWAIGNTNGDMLGIPWGTYSKRDEIADLMAFRDECLARLKIKIEGPTRRRWIDHVLNRLAFERSMLGDVPRFDGDITPVILQAFAREHGADKPKATATDPGFFQLESPVPLPLHLADGRDYLELSADEWRDVMRACGYVVPAPVVRRVNPNKPAPVPLINPTAEQAEQLQNIWNLQMAAQCKASGYRDRCEANSFKAVTQALYSANSGGSYSSFETVEIDETGRRIQASGDFSARWDDENLPPVARIRVYSKGTGFYMPRAVVHISDKPAKALPLDLDAIEAATFRDIANAGEPASLDGAAYDPALLKIRRRRRSTSQADVQLFYNGRKIGGFGDDIRLVGGGQYEVRSDEHWHTVAQRMLTEAAQAVAE
jgi:Domain of unknown function (DUF3560)